MPSEKSKMLAGELYNGQDPELVADRLRARELTQALNCLAPTAPDSERAALQGQLFGAPTDVYVTPPFFCDYGWNIQLGRNVYFNANCIILDVARVSIGDNVLFGPAVQIYTPLHPMEAAQRRSGLEYARPVTIGDDVWVGGGAIICAGVSIGPRSVIGAGSVIVKDVPADVLVVGNPGRIVRSIVQQ